MDPKPAPMTPPPASGPTGAPLDPKLQEAYNKVMNFSADPSAANPVTSVSAQPLATDPTAQLQAPATDPMAANQTTAQPLAQPTAAQPTLTTPATPSATGMFSTSSDQTAAPQIPAIPTTSQPQTTVVINGATPSVHGANATPQGMKAKKKGSPLMPVLIFFGAIIFIALYAIIWIKIFNIKVPFLPF